MSRADRYQRRQQVECGLRVVDGEQQGLALRFRHGVATLEPGVIDFVYTVGGVRFIRRKPVRIRVLSVDRSDERAVPVRESFSAKLGFPVVKVMTDTATLEWVLSPEQAAWATQLVNPQK